MYKRVAIILPAIVVSMTTIAQTGNHVFSGAECNNFGQTDLAVPGGQIWITDRGAVPGYFSANGAATYTGASDMANVNGYIKYYSGTSPAMTFTYPIGTGSDLRALTLSAPASNGQYAAAWIAGDPGTTADPTAPNAGMHTTASLGPNIGGVSPAGQWDWQDLSNDAAGHTVTVSIPDMSGFALTENLRLVGWNGTEWIDLSGTATATGNSENNSLSGVLASSITALAIGSTSTPLPLTSLRLSASLQDGVTKLSWTTLRESNNMGFNVERSKDGRVWQKLTFINSKGENGNSYIALTYLSYDSLPLYGSNYYRLKQQDYDGKFTYSNTVVANLENQTVLHAYPNPTSDLLNIEGIQDGSILQISDIRGKIIFRERIKGQSTILNIRPLRSGTYLLQAVTKTGDISVLNIVKS